MPSTPEESIGDRCHSLDPLGRYKCWNLKEKSPAHTIWKQVLRPITSLLEDQFQHLDTKGCQIMVEMFMIGKKAKSASPTILVSCERKVSRQVAMELVQRNGILAPYPEIRMAECSKLPRLLAMGDDFKSFDLPEGVYLNEPMPITSCGLSILVVSRDGARPRKATIGGFVCIEGTYYGLTTAHAFADTPPEVTEKEENQDIEFAFYGSSDGDDSSDEEYEADMEFMTSKGKIDEWCHHQWMTDFFSQLKDLDIILLEIAGCFSTFRATLPLYQRVTRHQIRNCVLSCI